MKKKEENIETRDVSIGTYYNKDNEVVNQFTSLKNQGDSIEFLYGKFMECSTTEREYLIIIDIEKNISTTRYVLEKLDIIC